MALNKEVLKSLKPRPVQAEQPVDASRQRIAQAIDRARADRKARESMVRQLANAAYGELRAEFVAYGCRWSTHQVLNDAHPMPLGPERVAEPKVREITYRGADGLTHAFREDNPAYTLRGDGRVEKVCQHGVGHPVGHTSRWDATWMGVHGCCGCCHVELPPGCEETHG